MRAFAHQEKILYTESPRNKQGRSPSREICRLTFFHFPSKPQMSTLSTSTFHLYISSLHFWPFKKGDFLSLTEPYHSSFSLACTNGQMVEWFFNTLARILPRSGGVRIMSMRASLSRWILNRAPFWTFFAVGSPSILVVCTCRAVFFCEDERGECDRLRR